MKLFHTILLLAVWHTTAIVISRAPFKQSLDTWTHGSQNVNDCFGPDCATRRLFPRAGGREKCSPPDYAAGAQQRRDVDHIQSPGTNDTLQRRMILPAPNGPEQIEEYIMRETQDPNVQMFVWNTGSGAKPSDVNTAISRDFSMNRNLFTPDLKGCTVLAVISRKGVFLGHYWESISFDPDATQRLVTTTGQLESDDEIWDRTVRKGLTEGVNVKSEGVPQQQSLTDFARDFSDEHTKAYLIRPQKSQSQELSEEGGAPPAPEAEWGYPTRWAEMRTIVEGLIPAVKKPGGWTTRVYMPVSGSQEEVQDQLDSTSRGRVLFKFDTTHSGSRRKPVRRAMLWSEQQELHSDEWNGWDE